MAQESAASMLRLLHAKDERLDRSLAVARQLQAALSLSQGMRGEAGIETDLVSCLRLAPVNVRAHYQRMLLDWTVLSLSKASAQPASPETLTMKRRKLNSGGKASSSQAAHHVLGSLRELWRLLEALLSLAGSAQGSAAHPSLAEAAARTCQAALALLQSKPPSRVAQHHAAVAAPAADEGLDTGFQLPLAVHGSMELLQKGHSPQTFSSSVRFAEAALQAAAASAEQSIQAKSTDAWCKLAAQAVSQLMAACKSQPDHKKSFKTVTRLLVPILRMNPKREGGTASWRALVSTGRQLLDAVLLSNEHMVHLQALALASLDPLSHNSQDDDNAPAADPSNKADDGKAVRKASRRLKYAALLTETISSELEEGDQGSLPDFLGGLPWLLLRFRAALKRMQSLEPAKASQKGALQNRGAAMAEFAFFALLLQLLMEPIEAASQGAAALSLLPQNKTASHARQCMIADGVAELLQVAAVQGNVFLTISSGPKVTLHHMAEADRLAEGLVRHRAASSRVDRCACCVGIYKPTQDAEGLQRKTSEKTGDGIFQWCLRPPGQPVSPASELCNDLLSEAGHEAAASRQALSAARALEGLMDMEHRAVQPALDQLWTVIWKCALLDEGKAPAVRVASALLKAYGELRQLVHLLESLGAALGSPKCPASASTVISAPLFQDTLRKVTQEAPPGQRAALVGFVAATVRKTLKPHMMGPALATLTLLLTFVLKGVRVEVTTASAVATAVEGFIASSLAKPLRRALSTDEKEAVADSTSIHELAALLQLYGTALRLHAACAAMQPQVLPLPGQAIIMDPHADEAARPGYFDALLVGEEDRTLRSMNSLAVNYAALFKGLLLGEDQEGLAALWRAAAICQTQRLAVLHERLLHLEYSCPAVPACPNLPAEQPTGAASTAVAAGESEPGTSAPAEPSAEAAEAEEAPLQATLRQRTSEELCQVANGLTSLCMLNDMARQRIAADDTFPDALVGIGATVKRYHGLIVRYAGVLVKQNFLTSLLGGAMRQQRLQFSELCKDPRPSIEGRSRVSANPRETDDAEANGLSFSAAALQLLKGQEFWETAELAERWPRAVAGKLLAAGNTITQSWLQLAMEDTTSSESLVEPLQPTEVTQPGGSMLAGTREHLEACLHLLQQISEAEMHSMQGFEPANKVHKEALQCAKQAAGVLPGCALPQGSDSAVSTSMTDGLAAAEGLFRLLCNTPLQWLEAHAFETWNLMNIALAFQSLLLRLSAVFREQMSPSLGSSPASRPWAGLLRASAAVQCFIARVAACGSTSFRSLLELPCKESGLGWPFQIAGALQEFLAAPPSDSSALSGPTPDPASLHGTQSLLEASAAIMHHTSRHLLLNLGHPVAGERSMRMVGECKEALQASAPRSADAQLHHAQQLEALCAALRSATAAATSSAVPKSEAAEPDTHGDSISGPKMGTGLFARPHLLRLVAELAGMLNVQQSALSAARRDASPVVGIQAYMACLLNAAASLLEAAQLLKQPDGSGGSTAADNDEAADLIATLPSYLSLACDVLQGHRPPEGDGRGEARDWPLLQKPVSLLRAAASVLQHMPAGTWTRLAALHVHCLRQLSPHLVDPGPQRLLNVSLGIILPMTLGAAGGESSRHASAFHQSVLLSVQDLARAAAEADLQELYASAPQLLGGYGEQPGAACALLQVVLLVVESAHSGPAMRMLNRHAQGLASALMSHLLTIDHQSSQGSVAAAQCLALRCLEALAVRDSVVKLSGQLTGAVLHLPYELLTTVRTPTRSGGIFTACCHVLLGMVRHRTAAVRRCMALLAASARALLQDLLRWQAPKHADVARQCAQHLSHLFEDIAERKEVLGMYCHFMLADYITVAAAPLGTAGPGSGLPVSREQHAAQLLPAAAAALKPGACALYGACSPAQVQHVYTVLQKSGGGTRQAAMTALRHLYESTVRFSGKI